MPDDRGSPITLSGASDGPARVIDRIDNPAAIAKGREAGGRYPKFSNDHGVPEIRIGVREFKCVGVSPPLDHPHVYINMGEADTILCPYCATRFRFDPRLTPLTADPPDSYFTDHN
jgi:uncharacterized Zn-finger protein